MLGLSADLALFVGGFGEPEECGLARAAGCASRLEILKAPPAYQMFVSNGPLRAVAWRRVHARQRAAAAGPRESRQARTPMIDSEM